MEVKLISHFQKLHFPQNLVQVRSTIATLRKLYTFAGNCYTIRQWGEKKTGDADQYALLIWDALRGRIGNFFTTRGKNIEWVCTKQYDRLFPSARSHGQQMGEGLYETEVQPMVRNTVKK